jgi:hypothetical protein
MGEEKDSSVMTLAIGDNKKQVLGGYLGWV